jgi:hypothetical protein
MGEVEHCRRTRNLPKRRGVLAARRVQVYRFHGHGVNLLGAQRTMREQGLPQVSEVSVGVSWGCHALVHLDDMHGGPGQVFISQRPQHRPRGAAPTDRHDEATARRDGRPRLPGGEGDGRLRHRNGIGQGFDLHGNRTVGLCQPPSGETLESTSFGPQVPGSYSWTGVSSFSTGSTIRHASST